MAKNKHLTDAERLQIEQWLKDRVSIKQIALKLGKSTSTVSREIRSRAITSDKYAPYRIHNRCIKRNDCQRRYLCGDKPNCTKRCSTCSLCNELCGDYQEQYCYKLCEPPYVCNGCVEEYQCVLRKKYYLHRKAHEAYREMLVESRVGANITEDELLALDEIVSPLVSSQSVHHIVTIIPTNSRLAKIHLPLCSRRPAQSQKHRYATCLPHKTAEIKPVEHKVDSGCRIGHTPSFWRLRKHQAFRS